MFDVFCAVCNTKVAESSQDPPIAVYLCGNPECSVTFYTPPPPDPDPPPP
jgi:hypothetical protein